MQLAKFVKYVEMNMNKQYALAILFTCLWMPMGANAQTCNTGMPETTPTTGATGFTYNTDGTVTHLATGLVWKRCLEGLTFSDNGSSTNYGDDLCTGTADTLDWRAALEKAQTVNATGFGGQRDWRVPNLKELKSLVEYCRSGTAPLINLDVFPNVAVTVWSSSPVVNDTAASTSWSVNFNDGSDVWDNRNSTNTVRLVRAGL
jgi:hypothetical protein